MSIYIKGMEMPTSCYKCPLRRRDGMDIVCPVAHERFSVADVNILEYRLDNCPLVPVPPHGRLIDADDVYKRLQKQAMSVWGGGNPRYQIVLEVMDAIRFAPTVIPAEEGE